MKHLCKTTNRVLAISNLVVESVTINIILLFLLALSSCKKQQDVPQSYKTKTLKIEQLSQHTFVHTSYLKEYKNYPCNGLIFFNDGEAILFDTPTDNAASKELINWVTKELNCKIKAVVINHYHIDCLGGLKAFHNIGIKSIASNLTVELAKSKGKEVPKIGFEKALEINIGNKKVVNTYFGEAHAKDNIVSYIPSEKVVFGGCEIKAVGANKGSLTDANISEWSNTVTRIKNEYATKATVIVPGHGKSGGIELLDYTIKLFKKATMKETQKTAIDNYIQSYNTFDIEGMIKELHENIVFENKTNGEVTLTTKGIKEFKKQAEAAKEYFKNRQQVVTSYKFSDNNVTVEIDYKAVLAIDLPNGMKAGDTLKLKGQSVFVFKDEKIISIKDKS